MSESVDLISMLFEGVAMLIATVYLIYHDRQVVMLVLWLPSKSVLCAKDVVLLICEFASAASELQHAKNGPESVHLGISINASLFAFLCIYSQYILCIL